jgi:hypothetical protein
LAVVVAVVVVVVAVSAPTQVWEHLPRTPISEDFFRFLLIYFHNLNFKLIALFPIFFFFRHNINYKLLKWEEA